MIARERTPLLAAVLRILRNVLNSLSADELPSILHDSLPGLLKVLLILTPSWMEGVLWTEETSIDAATRLLFEAYESPHSGVRKEAVHCLVLFYNVLDESVLCPFVRHLNQNKVL